MLARNNLSAIPVSYRESTQHVYHGDVGEIILASLRHSRTHLSFEISLGAGIGCSRTQGVSPTSEKRDVHRMLSKFDNTHNVLISNASA